MGPDEVSAVFMKVFEPKLHVYSRASRLERRCCSVLVGVAGVGKGAVLLL